LFDVIKILSDHSSEIILLSRIQKNLLRLNGFYWVFFPLPAFGSRNPFFLSAHKLSAAERAARPEFRVTRTVEIVSAA